MFNLLKSFRRNLSRYRCTATVSQNLFRSPLFSGFMSALLSPGGVLIKIEANNDCWCQVVGSVQNHPLAGFLLPFYFNLHTGPRWKVRCQIQRTHLTKIMFRGRLMRRTIARYLIVALIQCLRMTSIQVGVQWEVHIDKIFTKKKQSNPMHISSHRCPPPLCHG